MARAQMPRGWTVEEALSRRLTEDEEELFREWNRHTDIEENRRVYGDAEPVRAPEPINEGNTGDADPFTVDDGRDTAPLGQPLSEAQRAAQAANQRTDDTEVDVEAQRAEEERLAAGPGSEEDDEASDGTGDEFDQMRNPDLRDWLRERGESTTGNRAALLQRARQYDAEH